MAVFASSNAGKAAHQARSDGRWYDKSKWSNTASTQSYNSNVEGSGNSDAGVSDLDEAPKGLGPDDEDSADTGSGSSALHETPEEGSGGGPVKFEPESSVQTTTSFYHTHMTTQNATSLATTATMHSHDVRIDNVDYIPPVPGATNTTLATQTVAADHVTTVVAATTHLSTTTVWPPSEIDDTDDDEDEDDEEGDDDSDVIGGIDEFQPPQPPIHYTMPPPVVQHTLPPATSESPTLIVKTRPPHDIYDEAPPPVDKRGGDRWGLEWLLNPGVLTAVIGGAFVGLLAAILLVMLVVYRMRKKDEGSYVLEEPKAPPTYPYAYQKAPAREFYA